MNTPHPARASPAPPPRPRPASVPPLPNLALLLHTAPVSHRVAAVPAGRPHSVDPKPRPLLLDRPYEVGGAQRALSASAKAIPPPAPVSRNKPSGEVWERQSLPSKRPAAGAVKPSTPTLFSASSRCSSSRTPTTASDRSSRSGTATPLSLLVTSSRSVTSSNAGSASAVAPTSAVSSAQGVLSAGAVEARHPPIFSFRSTSRHSSPQTDRLRHSPAFRGLTPRVRPASSHQPDTSFLDAALNTDPKPATASTKPNPHPTRPSLPSAWKVEESKESLTELPHPQPPPESRTTRPVAASVDPDEFLDLIRTDPTQAFRLIFPDYPLNRQPATRIALTPPRADESPKPATGRQWRERTESTARQRINTDPFDVQHSSAETAAETRSHDVVPHTTSAFHTQFPTEEEAQGERVGGDEDEEEEARSMIRGLIVDAQHRSGPPSRPPASHSPPPTPPHEDIEEEAATDCPDSPRSAAADETAAQGMRGTQVRVSAPSSPSEAAGEERGRAQVGLLVPPREESPPSPHHLSPSSFTIASSAPASPVLRSDQSDDEWTL